jgi:hypothetical protein
VEWDQDNKKNQKKTQPKKGTKIHMPKVRNEKCDHLLPPHDLPPHPPQNKGMEQMVS